MLRIQLLGKIWDLFDIIVCTIYILYMTCIYIYIFRFVHIFLVQSHSYKHPYTLVICPRGFFLGTFFLSSLSPGFVGSCMPGDQANEGL